MADLKIPKRGISDRFNLQDFKDDFNALNEEKATKDELNELKTNGRVGELVVGNEALRIYQVNNADVELYSRLEKLSIGTMNKSGTNTVGFCVEPTDIGDGFQVRPYTNQYMNIGAPYDSFKINDIYSKGKITANSIDTISVVNGEKGVHFMPERSELLRFSNGSKSLDFIVGEDGRTRLEPYVGKEYDLGGADYNWKNIWLNGFDYTYWAGYTKLPNNCIIQWGTTGIGKGSNVGEVTFALAFPNFCNKVIVTPGVSETRHPLDLCYCVTGTTQNGFQMKYNQPRQEYQEFHYIAIGY